MRVIDLFAGCGGLSLGFAEAGFEIIAAFDNWEPAIKVYRANFLDHPIIQYDLGAFQGDTTAFEKFQPDMIIGGPPCQDFSSAGKRDRTLGRADLTNTFASIVTAMRTEWFVMENVERALKSDTYKVAYRRFHEAGYGLTQVVLDASLCGVPQSRKRLFLVGHLQDCDDALSAYLASELSCKPLTVREYLGSSLDIEHYYRHPRSYQRRGIFSIDEPSPTIRGVNRPIPPNYAPHSGDTSSVTADLRPLTTKERSLIQTFPPEFWFLGTKADQEQMIGNAVPVNLAKYVATCILKYQKHLSEGLIVQKPPLQLQFALDVHHE